MSDVVGAVQQGEPAVKDFLERADNKSLLNMEISETKRGTYGLEEWRGKEKASSTDAETEGGSN